MKRVTLQISSCEANRITLTNLNLLHRAKSGSISRIATNLAGLHASRFISPLFSLAARMETNCFDSISDELYASGNFVKIRCVRGTLHILTPYDASVFHKATRKKRKQAYDYLKRRASISKPYEMILRDRIISFLSISPANYDDLIKFTISKERVASQKTLEAARLIIRILWEEGIISRLNGNTNWRIERKVYQLNSNVFWTRQANSLPENEAEEIIIKRYFTSYGPTTINDAAWWSEISVNKIKEILLNNSEEFIEIKIDNCRAPYFLNVHSLDALGNGSDCTCGVKLLPYEDNLLKGYKTSRYRFVDPNYYSEVYNPAGEANATILVNDKILGIWKYNRAKNEIQIKKFDLFPRMYNIQLMQEVERLCRIINGSCSFIS